MSECRHDSILLLTNRVCRALTGAIEYITYHGSKKEGSEEGRQESRKEKGTCSQSHQGKEDRKEEDCKEEVVLGSHKPPLHVAGAVSC